MLAPSEREDYAARTTHPSRSPTVSTIESPYWNAKTETLPKEQLQALQLVKLQHLVQRAVERLRQDQSQE